MVDIVSHVLCSSIVAQSGLRSRVVNPILRDGYPSSQAGSMETQIRTLENGGLVPALEMWGFIHRVGDLYPELGIYRSSWRFDAPELGIYTTRLDSNPCVHSPVGIQG